MIKYISGDILQTECDYIAQGVATGLQEGLGTGLALKISKKFPIAQKQFKKHARSHKFGGGDIYLAQNELEEVGIIYIATQPDMYHATIPFLTKGIRRLAKLADKKSLNSIAIPKIGAGLGKLDWSSEVKPLLERYLNDSTIHFVVYEDYKLEYEN